MATAEPSRIITEAVPMDFEAPIHTPVETPSAEGASDPLHATPTPPTTPFELPEQVPVMYDGDQNYCSICLSNMMTGERVCRLICRHVFHSECWNDYMTRQNAIPQWDARRPEATPHPSLRGLCPNCRGPGNLTASWSHISLETLTQNVRVRDSSTGIEHWEPIRNELHPEADAANDSDDLPELTAEELAAAEVEDRRMQEHLIQQRVAYQQYTQDRVAAERLASAASTPRTHRQSPFSRSPRSASPRPRSTSRPRDQSPDSSSSAMVGLIQQETQGPWHPLAPTYQVRTTSLADGRPSLIIDPGSVGNLCGNEWAKQMAIASSRFGKDPSFKRRESPINVSGVGHGSQQATHDCYLPVAFRKKNGPEGATTRAEGHISISSVQNSTLPGLMGLNALRKNRAVLDFNTQELLFLGPGDYDLMKAVPPGTDVFDLERAPSGHLVIPCCEYEGLNPQENGGDTLTLLARDPAPASNEQNQRPQNE